MAHSWTEGNNLNTGRTGIWSFGIETACVVVEVIMEPNVQSAVTEEYDGTSWSEVQILQIRGEHSGLGTLTAGLI